MNAPSSSSASSATSLSSSSPSSIGIGFGFFLERAGFGSARKLAAQFYFTDMTVFKVMFTAIVTAMLGSTTCRWWACSTLAGLHQPTYLWPQIVGGLMLGVGFIVGGYCPGTSCVAVATGKLDALVFFAGSSPASSASASSTRWSSGFYNSTAMGELTLPQTHGLPYGCVVFAVVLMALGGFAGAEWVEKRMAARKAGA